MRLGVVCEGLTDYTAIKAFFGNALSQYGITSEFIPVQLIEAIASKGGWGRVLKWLEKNDPNKRSFDWFDGGPFGGNLALEPLDCLLIHLDADILGEVSFSAHVKNKLDYTVLAPIEPSDRAKQIQKILQLAWHDDEMTNDQRKLHVPVPAVESTETWCLAAFSEEHEDFERIIGQNLIDRFMSALIMSEGKNPKDSYPKIDKNNPRRQYFCGRHAENSLRIVAGCAQFEKILNHLIGIAN